MPVDGERDTRRSPLDAVGMPLGGVVTYRDMHLTGVVSVGSGMHGGEVVASRRAVVFEEVDLWWPGIAVGPQQRDVGHLQARLIVTLHPDQVHAVGLRVATITDPASAPAGCGEQVQLTSANNVISRVPGGIRVTARMPLVGLPAWRQSAAVEVLAVYQTPAGHAAGRRVGDCRVGSFGRRRLRGWCRRGGWRQ